MGWGDAHVGRLYGLAISGRIKVWRRDRHRAYAEAPMLGVCTDGARCIWQCVKMISASMWFFLLALCSFSGNSLGCCLAVAHKLLVEALFRLAHGCGLSSIGLSRPLLD